MTESLKIFDLIKRKLNIRYLLFNGLKLYFNNTFKTIKTEIKNFINAT